MNRTSVFNRSFACVALVSLLAACSGGGSPVNPSPTATPVPTPSPTGTITVINPGGTGGGSGTTSSTAYTCPTSDTASSIASSANTEFGRRRSGVQKNQRRAQQSTGFVAVTYSGSSLDARAKSLATSREAVAGASLIKELSFSHVNRYTRVLRVTPGTEPAAIAQLKQQSNVVAATMTNFAAQKMTVASKYYTNDPYYNGFMQAQLNTAGAPASVAPTYHVDPYEESSSVGGQWGMHAVRLDYAEAYSQSGNGSGITNAGALGSSSVKIAVIDTGADSSHPELTSKIVSQKCFLTNTTGTQSSSNFAVDQDGHGTDVSGIAAEAIGNGLGFAGAGGNSSLMAYQVFPQPDDSCVVGSTTSDNQCGATTGDIVSAIMDATKNGANVINLSLGVSGVSCTNGQDPDTAEATAVAEAIAAGVVVVSASGNNAGTDAGVAPPACDTNVIAVGASALSDGVANGSSSTPAGSASAPVEYVASYSQFGSPAAAPNSTSAWGIVAPGGDPSDAEANATTSAEIDNLHWIENIWTSTPFDDNFAGECKPDTGNLTGQNDCRTLIAGTSQATPVVAGAAALIIAANSSYKSATKMKQLLCSTAHDIGDPHEGCGRLDIYRAMATAVGDGALPASK